VDDKRLNHFNMGLPQSPVVIGKREDGIRAPRKTSLPRTENAPSNELGEGSEG